MGQEWMSSHDFEIMVGKQIRAARLAQGISQSRIAEKSNVSISALGKLESGKGSNLNTLVKVMRALGLDDQLSHIYREPPVSPMQLLRESKKKAPRRRAPRQVASV